MHSLISIYQSLSNMSVYVSRNPDSYTPAVPSDPGLTHGREGTARHPVDRDRQSVARRIGPACSADGAERPGEGSQDVDRQGASVLGELLESWIRKPRPAG